MHEAWTDYFKESLNLLGKGITPEKVYFRPQQDIGAPSVQEISDITRKLNNRTPGEDSITAYLVKGGGRTLQRKIQIMLKTVWKKEQMPGKRNCATICPMYRKGNKMECSNY